MKKRNLVISVLLSLVMMVTMVPMTSFAATVEKGTQDKPFAMTYDTKGQYWGNSYDCTSNEIWFSLTPKYSANIKLSASFTEGEYDVKSISFINGGNASALSKTADDEAWIEYSTSYMPLQAGSKYYIKVELNAALGADNSFVLYACTDENFARSGSGAETDPYQFTYDSHSDTRYTLENYSLSAGTKTIWATLEAKEDCYSNINALFIDGAKKESIEIYDASYPSKKIAVVSSYNKSEDKYYLKGFKLDEGSKYIFKINLESCAEDAGLYIYVEPSKGNGKTEHPFIMSSDISNGLTSYWGDSQDNKSKVSTMWFVATMLGDGKMIADVNAYNSSTLKDRTSVISSAKVYLNSQSKTTVTLKKQSGYYQSSTFNVKSGDVVYIKIQFTSKSTSKDVVNANICQFGIADTYVDLNSWSYVWDGNPKTPTVTSVKLNSTGKKLIAGTDYDTNYSYENNTEIGHGILILKGMGSYPGEAYWNFEIKPLGTTMASVVAGKKALTANWLAQETLMSTKNITGYQLQYATSSKFTSAKSVTIKGYATTSKTITKLKKGKKYYVRVRTYYYDEEYDGNVYSSWSGYKSVKVK